MFEPRKEDGTMNQIAPAIYEQLKQGAIILLKWTCPRCGERVTATNPLKLIEHPEFPGQQVVAFPPGYTHDEKDDGSPCGELVNMREYRFNYTVIIGTHGLDFLR